VPVAHNAGLLWGAEPFSSILARSRSKSARRSTARSHTPESLNAAVEEWIEDAWPIYVRALEQLRLPFDLPPAPQRAGRARQVQLAGGVLSYRLVRARRRTIGLTVEAEGVHVRAPRHAALADIEVFIREKERWIKKRLAAPRRVPFVWQAGAKLPWLGRIVTLTLRHGEAGAWFSAGDLGLGLADGASPRERALDWMRARALEFFRERVARLAGPLGLHVSSVGLSDAQTAGAAAAQTGEYSSTGA